MPISLATAELSISIVNGIIKLGGKVDKILAEQDAGEAELALPSFTTTRRTPVARLLRELADLLEDGQISLGTDRDRIQEIVEGTADPVQAEVEAFILKYLPEALKLEIRNDNQFVEDQLRRLSTDWDFGDADIRRLALYVGSGRDLREGSLEWRLALAVVDVLAEFALEQQQRIVRSEAGRKVIATVLQRFTEGDLEEEATTAGLLLKRVVNATLNGLLDSREAWDGDNQWIEAILDALSDARAQAEVSDDFLLGLFQGGGYRAFIVELLEEGGERLSRKEGDAYRQILAEILREAAKQAAESQDGFQDFFQDHWTDLARAGLRSFGKYGPIILDEANPILETALLAAVRSLAETGNRDLISPDNLVAATEAAIAAVAAKPELLAENADWAPAFYGAFASVVRDEGLRNTFSKEGLEILLLRTAAVAAENPELIVARPGFAQEVTGTILKKISEVESLRSGPLATAVVVGALTTIEQNPNLLDTRYAEILGDFAGKLAELVKARSITGLQAEDLAAAAAEAIAENPDLFAEGGDPSWLQAAYGAFADVLADNDLKQTFSAKGLEAIVKTAMRTVSENPELLIADHLLPQTVLANVLKKLAGTPDVRIETLATAAVDGTLTAFVENPGLLDTPYAEVIGDLAGRLADRVRTGSTTGLEAQYLIAVITETVAANPDVLANLQNRLTIAIVDKVLDKVSENQNKALAAIALLPVVESVLSVVAMRGENLLSGTSVEELTSNIGDVVNSGLTAAARELGRQLDLPTVPVVVMALIEAWARGEITTVDLESESFNMAFAKLAAWASRSRELPAPSLDA